MRNYLWQYDYVPVIKFVGDSRCFLGISFIFSIIYFLRSSFIKFYVYGSQDIHYIMDWVLSFFRQIAMFWGDYLYSQRMLFISMLRCVDLISERSLCFVWVTFCMLLFGCWRRVRWLRWVGSCVWSQTTPCAI
jgi:hypothetical protein